MRNFEILVGVWDQNQKGLELTISENGKMIRKTSGQNAHANSSVRGSIGWSKGKHSWTLELGILHSYSRNYWINVVCDFAS